MQESSNRTVGLGVKLPVASADEFVARFGSSLSRGGIYLRTKRTVAPGTRVRLDLKLADGSSLLCSPGRVDYVTKGEVSGMGIRFIDVPDQARQFLDAVTPKLSHGALEMPPIPVGVGEVDRGETTSLELTAAAELLTSPTVPAPAPKSEVGAASAPQATPFDKLTTAPAAQDNPFDKLSAELRGLRRSVRISWAAAVALGVAAFFAGRSMHPSQPAIVAPVVTAPVVTVDEQRAIDMEPAFEDELTDEEKALAEEVLAGAEPPPPVVEKVKPVVKKQAVLKTAAKKTALVAAKKQPAVKAKKVLVASNSARGSDASKSSSKKQHDARAEGDGKLIAESLAAGRGSKCKARFDALTDVVAKTKISAHREAGIVLRARCFADTWRSQEAKTEFGRYLREFPNGKYAEEARRVLAL